MTKLLLLVKSHTEMWATTRTKNRKEKDKMTNINLNKHLLVKARAEIRATKSTKEERDDVKKYKL